jgi:hypothetical protein
MLCTRPLLWVRGYRYARVKSLPFHVQMNEFTMWQIAKSDDVLR